MIVVRMCGYKPLRDVTTALTKPYILFCWSLASENQQSTMKNSPSTQLATRDHKCLVAGLVETEADK